VSYLCMDESICKVFKPSIKCSIGAPYTCIYVQNKWVRLNTAQDSWVHSGYDAVILVWHMTCKWLQYIIVIELSKFCADSLNDLGVMKDFRISLWHAAHYTTGWLIDHAWKSNKQFFIVSLPNKLFIAKTGIHNK
jgi:hypothetical protein